MTREETRQVEQLARQLARDEGFDPDESYTTSKKDVRLWQQGWEWFVSEAAEQLGFVREEG